jgi:hypothetical protein
MAFNRTDERILSEARGMSATKLTFTVPEAAREFGISESSMRRLVRDLPGVFELGRVHKKRIIPHALLERIKQDGSRGFVANFQLGNGGVKKTLVRRGRRLRRQEDGELAP